MQAKEAPCHQLFRPFSRGHLLVGFSGGADSTAALLLALQFRNTAECRVTAVHFDHHLRGEESRREAEAAARFAADHGAGFLKIDLQLPPQSDSMEAAAREARLAAWRRLARDPGCAVVLGHHADDRAENFFLRLLRGSNVGGLTGLREKSVVGGVTFLRPLLSWRREEIEAFLRASGIREWAMDSSNREETIRRNRLRNEILPMLYQVFPGFRKGLQVSLDALETDALFLESCAREKMQSGDPRSAAFWRAMPPALLPRALRLHQWRELGEDTPFSGDALRRFAAAVQREDDPEPCRIPLAGNREMVLQNGLLHWVRPVPDEVLWVRSAGDCCWGEWVFHEEPAPERCREGDDENCCCFDPELLPAELYIGPVRPGDIMVPFGGTGSVKVKKLRVDKKIPASAQLPVLRDAAGKIYWIPGLRRSAEAPVTGRACRIVVRREVI